MKKLTINIPKDIINKLDEIAKERYTNRTEIIKSMLIESINNYKKI